MMEGYKVCMAFENTNLSGYVTEKLPAAFFAGCVPIYWGDRSVFEVFNAEAFIYAGDDPNDVATIRSAVDKALQVAQDPQVAQRYLSAPRLAPGAWDRFFR